jgi:hypothetical protein
MTGRFRRLVWGAMGLITVLIVIERVEKYTADGRAEEFFSRVTQIREGMSETDVRRVAGVPSEIVTNSANDNEFRHGAECLNAGAAQAFLYTLDHKGWFGERLALSSGTSILVVCLDRSGVVTDQHMVLVTY